LNLIIPDQSTDPRKNEINKQKH